MTKPVSSLYWGDSMDIDIILTEIKKRIPGATILYMCKIGSDLFCKNCKDTDVMVIADGVSFSWKSFKLYDLNTSVFCVNRKYGLKIASGENFAYGLTIALATGENLLYGKLPFEEYSWDKYKLNVLGMEYNRFCVRFLRFAQKTGVCDKAMTWTFATYFACINDTLDFNEEQRDILQKCHDSDLPVSYAEELKVNMEQILFGSRKDR